MISDLQRINLWNHNPINESFTISISQDRQFSITISTQVLKLAIKYVSNPKTSSCTSLILLGSIKIISGRINVNLDRLEYNDFQYLTEQNITCHDDIIVPFQIEKSDKAFVQSNLDSSFHLNFIKNFYYHHVDSLTSISISKSMNLTITVGLDIMNIQMFRWIEVKMFLPDFHVNLTEINPLNVFRSALLSSFQSIYSIDGVENLNFGYLSWDQSKKVQFLLSSDTRVLSFNIVGIWIHGPLDLYDIRVTIAALKYCVARNIEARVCTPPYPFLLAVIEDSNAIKFYEVKWPIITNELQQNQTLIKCLKFKGYSASDSLDRFYSGMIQSKPSFNINLAPTGKYLDAFMQNWKQFINKLNDINYDVDLLPRQLPMHPTHLSRKSNYDETEVPDVSLVMSSSGECASSLSDQSLSNNLDNNNNKSSSNHRLIHQSFGDTIVNERGDTIEHNGDVSITTSFSHTKNKSSSNNSVMTKDEAIPRPELPKHYLQYSPGSTNIKDPTNYPALTNACIYQNPYMPYHLMPTHFYHPFNNPYPMSINQSPMFTTPKPNSAASRKKRKPHQPINDDHQSPAPLDQSSNQNPSSLDMVQLQQLVQQMIKSQQQQNLPCVTNASTMTSEIEISTAVTTDVNHRNVATQTIEQLVDQATDPMELHNGCCKCCVETKNNSRVSVGVSTDEVNVAEEQITSLNDNSNSLNNNSSQYQNQFKLNQMQLSSNHSEMSSSSFSDGLDCDESDSTTVLNHCSDHQAMDIALEHLRQLDAQSDVLDHQFWDNIKLPTSIPHHQQQQPTSMANPSDISAERTILLQRINYMSILLNRSGSEASDRKNESTMLQSSHKSNDQSIYIESLARKYLHKAHSDLSKLQDTNNTTTASTISNNIMFLAGLKPSASILPASSSADGTLFDGVSATDVEFNRWFNNSNQQQQQQSQHQNSQETPRILDINRLKQMPKYL